MSSGPSSTPSQDLRRVATVYVTHDYAEALSLGDRIGVMGNGGRLAQTGTPHELFERPASLFVAEHLGQPTINAIPSILVQTRRPARGQGHQGQLRDRRPEAAGGEAAGPPAHRK